jgi:hypothetical protein
MCGGADLTDPDVVLLIEAKLDMAASDIHAALASVGACGCTLETWAVTYLKKLNVIDAAVIQQCPCGNMPDEQKQMWLDWLQNQFEGIRSGKIVVCQGETGSDYPAFASAELNYTEWSEAEIILHREQRTP